MSDRTGGALPCSGVCVSVERGDAIDTCHDQEGMAGPRWRVVECGRETECEVQKEKSGCLSDSLEKAPALERTDVEAVKYPAGAGSLNDDSG